MGLSLASKWLNPWDQRVSITGHFYIGVWEGFNGDTLGRLVFFNDAQYGPYRGSIISITNDKDPPAIRRSWSVMDYNFSLETTFKRKGDIDLIEKSCDLPGVYFRHFQRPDQPHGLWTLMMSFGYPLGLFSILPAIWIFCRLQALTSKRPSETPPR